MVNKPEKIKSIVAEEHRKLHSSSRFQIDNNIIDSKETEIDNKLNFENLILKASCQQNT